MLCKHLLFGVLLLTFSLRSVRATSDGCGIKFNSEKRQILPILTALVKEEAGPGYNAFAHKYNNPGPQRAQAYTRDKAKKLEPKNSSTLPTRKKARKELCRNVSNPPANARPAS